MAGGPQNAIIGDDNLFEIPSTSQPDEYTNEERNAAKFSRTKEFAALKEYIENRIAYYSTFLPNSESVLTTLKTNEQLGQEWKLAVTVIGELGNIIERYEQANLALKK